jgi:hypothetical protein
LAAQRSAVSFGGPGSPAALAQSVMGLTYPYFAVPSCSRDNFTFLNPQPHRNPFPRKIFHPPTQFWLNSTPYSRGT